MYISPLILLVLEPDIPGGDAFSKGLEVYEFISCCRALR